MAAAPWALSGVLCFRPFTPLPESAAANTPAALRRPAACTALPRVLHKEASCDLSHTVNFMC